MILLPVPHIQGNIDTNVVYVVLNGVEPFCVENRAVCAALAISRFARSCSSLLLPSDLCRQHGTSSTVTSSPSLMSSAIVSISWSIRLKAANVQQSESGTSDSISGYLSVSRSKRIRMLLGQHLTSGFILKFASTRS